jgi:hypothetical protein
MAKLRHPDEVTLVRGMGLGQNGRRYLYRLSNPEVRALLPVPIEQMHEATGYDA